MASPSKITTKYWHPKMESVLSAVEEPASITSQWTITIEMEMLEGFSALDATRRLLDLWTSALTSEEPTVTSGTTGPK